MSESTTRPARGRGSCCRAARTRCWICRRRACCSCCCRDGPDRSWGRGWGGRSSWPRRERGARLEGTRELATAGPVTIRARVVWIDGDRVGLHLWPDAIPYPVLLAEERSVAPNRQP